MFENLTTDYGRQERHIGSRLFRKDNGKSLKEAFNDATDQPSENI